MKLLPAWLWNPEHRAVATFIGGGVGAVIAVIWTGFIYFHKQQPQDVMPPKQEGISETIYRVCKGDNKGKCMPLSYFIGCTDFADWTEKQCSRFDIEPVYKLTGGLCGYEQVQMKCVPK